MTCKNCGSEIKNNAKFCPQCGNSILTPEAVAEILHSENENFDDSRKNNNPAKKSKKNKALIIIGIVLVSFLIVGILAAVFGADELDDISWNNNEISASDQSIEAQNNNQKDKKTTAKGKQEEIIAEYCNDRNFKALADYYSECPDEHKQLFVDTFEKCVMGYLTEHRANLYSHDIDFIIILFENCNAVPIETLYTEDSTLRLLFGYVNRLYELKDSIYQFYELQESLMNCTEVTGNILNRIEDSENPGAYLNEYLLVRSEDYYQGDYIVLKSDEPLYKGYFSGYVRFIENMDYTSEGFEYSYGVYEPMTKREEEQYLMECEEYKDLANMMTYEDEYNFRGIVDVVNAYSKYYPAIIDDSNYIAEYVGGYDDFSYEYLHRITLHDDNTFDMMINYRAGMAAVSGTYSKEGNLLILENDDIYFELVITGDTLVYHNRMEYAINASIEEGTVFVR